jgi:DNA-binding GntR family transcriptional regulator
MTPATVVSLAEEAYVAIREEILRGQLRPGAPLSRRRLAGQFGMSTVPVSDALRRLEEEGLVESRARAGTRVRVPTAQDVRELYELREALESQSARLFAARATPAQRRDLKRVAEQVDVLFTRLATSGDDPAFRFTVNSQHMALHMRIAEHAGSPLIKQVIERKHVLISSPQSGGRDAEQVSKGADIIPASFARSNDVTSRTEEDFSACGFVQLAGSWFAQD